MEERWGDKIGKVSSKYFRLMFVNVGGIPANTKDPKNDEIQWLGEHYQCHVLGLAETNKNWKKIAFEERLPSRAKDWWGPKTTTVTANLQDDDFHGLRQFGNVASITMESAIDRKCGQGTDPKELGRWVWNQYRGTQGMHLKVYTAYSPVKNTTEAETVCHKPRQPGVPPNKCSRHAVILWTR